MEFLHWLIACVVCVVVFGCTTVIKERYGTCPYETIWQVALDTMKGHSLTTQNKDKGIIETGWLNIPASERTFATYGWQTADKRERAKRNVLLTRENGAIEVSVLETRQRSVLRGEPSTKATKWWPIEPSEKSMNDIMKQINSQLKNKGCNPL